MRPSHLSICFALVVIAGLAHGQGGFSKYYYLPDSLNSTATDVIETSDQKYLIAGRTDTLVGGFVVSRLTLMATDLSGNKLWTRAYGDLNMDYPDLFQRNQFYCAESNHVFVYTAGQDNSGNIFPVLFKLNYQGDTIWRKVYPWDPSANLIPQVMVKARDGGFYLGGYYQQKAGGHPIYLWRISDNGDLLWSKIINKAAPNVMSAADMLQDPVSGRIIITGYQYIGSGTFDNLIVLDSLGNKIVQKYYNDGCGSGGNVIQLKDGNFITAVQMKVQCQYSIFQAKAIKFDNTGKVIWGKLLNPSGPINAVNPLVEKQNGDWYGYGYLDSVVIQKMTLMLFDSGGNIKWKAGFGNAKDVYSPDYIRAINRTSDGGFIAAMQLNGEPAPRPFYIIKLDSMGCDTTPQYCAWQQTVALKEQKQLLQAEIFPNPCNDVLNIGISGNSFPVQVRVFDQSGRLLRIEETNNKKHPLSTSDLVQGLYLIEVRSSAGVFRGNFVVQR